MSLVISGGEHPRFGAGTRLCKLAPKYPKANEKVVKATEEAIAEANDLSVIVTLLDFLNKEGFAITGSRDYVYHAGLLSNYTRSVKELSVKDGPVMFMWNMYPRALGLRKKVMKLAGCSEGLIERLT